MKLQDKQVNTQDFLDWMRLPEATRPSLAEFQRRQRLQRLRQMTGQATSSTGGRPTGLPNLAGASVREDGT